MVFYNQFIFFLYYDVAVIVLDRANVEDALLPIPKVLDSHQIRNRHKRIDDEKIAGRFAERKGNYHYGKSLNTPELVGMLYFLIFCWMCVDDIAAMEVDSEVICLEDRLRSLGLLSKTDDIKSKSNWYSSILHGIDIEAVVQQKRVCFYVSVIFLVFV